jgi:hypothetical protein
MPSVRDMDNSQGHAGHAPAPGVCEPAQVRYPRKRRENWPFRFYEERGRMYENIVPRQKKSSPDDVGDALL